MAPLKLDRVVTNEIVATITRCGNGGRECIVYVVAPASDRHRAAGTLHPSHSATAVSTEVSGAELDRIWDEIARAGQTIVLQVHSHPGRAHHSGIDDHWPVVHRVGFPSLVLAHFGRSGFTGSHLAVYQGGGKWETPRSDQWSEHIVFETGK
jgi:proteasome lid subunit RPN8/RPN11